MVLEALVGVKEAEKTPFYVFLLGMLYASVAIFLSLWIFQSEASLIMVFLMVFASLPLIYKTQSFEARKDYDFKPGDNLTRIHINGLKIFMYLFLGFMVAMAVWYIFLPADTVYNLFSSQIGTIKSINSSPSTGQVTSWNFLSTIVLNNLKVLILSVLFSFFYGVGALFILSWNASVISAAMGNFIRTNLANYASTIGFSKFGAYLQVFSLALIRYMTHGLFEILAYLVGGLAGGLISIAMINKHFEGEHFKFIIKDAVDLLIFAVILVFVAGLIEVFITPIFF
ncbi:stage II sporulation protein M [Candidatus Woesearchaeota archaeon]|nr:stage II sporulation protein M [Candidatus Woesearchaeota archaeon]